MDDIILAEILAAKNGVANAESDLLELLKKIEVAPRAEKTLISEALHDAFQTLNDTREHIARLEALIRAKDD